MNIQQTIQKKINKAKASAKATTKEDVLLGLAIGVPTAGCILMGSELIARDVFAKKLWDRMTSGEVLETALESGGTLIIKIVKAGEEVCACEH